MLVTAALIAFAIPILDTTMAITRRLVAGKPIATPDRLHVPQAIDAIRDSQAVYLMAVGGAAYLVAQALKGARVLGFPELGMEAIYEFEVEDMPVTVAVDVNGDSVHKSGPETWKLKIKLGEI